MKFNFSWLKSSERKELDRLREEEIKRKAVEDYQGEQIKSWQANTAITFLKTEPCKSIRLINDNVIVVMHDGSTLSKYDGGMELFKKARAAQSEEELLMLFVGDDPFQSKENTNWEEKDLVNQNLRVIEDSNDFEVKDGEVYIKGLSMALPPVIVAAFIEILEKRESKGYVESSDLEEYNALRMFTLKLALNPIQSSREDCLTFIRKNDIRITATGNLVAYRGIVSVGKKDKKLSKFVSAEYFKVKKWKKSPSNYIVYITEEEQLVVAKNTQKKTDDVVGNLQELYDGIGKMEENTFTDAHTRKMKIKIGEIYSIDENKVDIDSRAACSSGLHVGSREFGISSFGDTKVLCLINPAKVRSVPYSDAQKMRVSEMYIVCALEIGKDGQYMDADVDLVSLDEDYHNYSLEELEEAVAHKSFEPVYCQGQLAPVTVVDMQTISDMLALRVKSVK